MLPRIRTILVQVGSFVLAGVLLYLALKGVDLSVLWDTLRTAEYGWLAPLVGVVLLSHLLRAWRWQLLLETLPERPEDAERVSVKMAFYSLMIGYMVNYAAPRLGEFVRTGNLSAQEKLRFSSVFGTVVAERILDVIVLLLAISSLFVLFFDRVALLGGFLGEPLVDRLGEAPTAGLLALVIGIGILLWLITRHLMRKEESRLQTFWRGRMVPALTSFKEGLATIWRCPKRGAIVFSTAAMWFCYLLMAYLPLLVLEMADTWQLSLLDAWGLMVLGALGVAIPSPGGIGSYHYITIESMVRLFGVAQGPAAAYAVLTHAAQLVLYVIVGCACILLQGASWRRVWESVREGKQETSGGDRASA